jgi:hypothetical protein
MNKYIEIIKLLERIFGKSAVSKSLGTRTNVVRLPRGKQPIDPTTRHFDVEGTAQKNPELVNTIKNSVEDRMGDITRMNDQELLTYKQNLQRLADHVDPPALPSADIISAGSKQRVTGEGIEALKQTSGQTNPPGTIVGNIESRINKLKDIGQQMEKQTGEKTGLGDLLKDYGQSATNYAAQQREGLVRATAREIIERDIAAGKLKGVTKEDLASKDPIDIWRTRYGEDALEQLDSLAPELGQLTTEKQAADLAKTKYKFEPKQTPVKESYTKEEMDEILKNTKTENKPAEVTNITAKVNKNRDPDILIEEYNKNNQRLSLTDEEGGTLIGYQEFNQLKNRNKEIESILDSFGIKSAEEIKPEGIVIPFRKKITEPENKADGGPIGLDYLMGFDNRPKYAGGGDVKKILDLIAKANKELKGKKSMETINPKTGEVTVPKEPVKTLNFDTRSEFDKLNLKHDKDIVAAANEIGVSLDDPKMAAQQIAEVYADMKLGKDYYDLSQNQQLDLYSKAYNYLTDMGSLKRQSSAVTKYNAGEKLEPFDQKIINKINDTQQKEILTDFDIKDRKPNKDGGLNHLLGF